MGTALSRVHVSRREGKEFSRAQKRRGARCVELKANSGVEQQ